MSSLHYVTSQYIVNEDAHLSPPGLRALPGGVKFPDSAGAFHYEDSGKLLSVTSNRFIHWSVCSIDASTKSAAFLLACLLTYSLNSVPHRSTSGDTVQLVEQSLDTNLLNNAIKIKFSHCTVLPGGIHVQENLNNVIILICTNQSVHRLLLAHPTRMYRSVSGRHLMQKELYAMIYK